MQNNKNSATRKQHPTAITDTAVGFLYEPLDFVMVRAPLLPIDTYLALSDHETDKLLAKPVFLEGDSLIPCDARIRWALAVGSSTLLDDLERSTPSSKGAGHLKGKLLRFLIRMSTRPTPYGLFAGVALGQWSEAIDLALAASQPHIRTRPDMAWLLNMVRVLESDPEIRRHLHFITNPTAFIHGDRVFMTEQASLEKTSVAQGASLRATGVVKKVMALARTSISYQDLADTLTSTTPGATVEKIERLITELWEQTLLLTDLRPPFTTDDPAHYVIQHLTGIPAAQEILGQLQAVVNRAAIHDTLPPEEGVVAYRQLIAQANKADKVAVDLPVQVDMALELNGQHLTQVIGKEAARTAELLLRMSPLPSGLPSLEAYRQAFLSRYGHDREIPLLEVLNPHFGLGSPAKYASSTTGISPAISTRRSQTLLNLACRALHDRQSVIELDGDTLKKLETWVPSLTTAPLSLDLCIFVAATSSKALDAGEFQIVVGPNLGAQAAGRNLGRFVHLLGPGAQSALSCAASAEKMHIPNKLWTELVYLPQNTRSSNVVIRPVLRDYEIALGVSAGVNTDKIIYLDDLVVGVRANRFYIRSIPEDKELIISAGHMLNNRYAPEVGRFLAEVGLDGIPLLSTFDWGPAAHFPFLPRVQTGRIVLCEAQWRIDTSTRTQVLPSASPLVFRKSLEHWREHWHVPRYVYLSAGDNRLLLDLECASQVEELRTEVRHLKDGGQIVLQEVLPGLNQVWLEGPDGHYMVEFVVSLIRQHSSAPPVNEAASTSSTNLATSPVRTSLSTILQTDWLKPPGSDWLFVKLYCGTIVEDDVIVAHVHLFAEEICSSGAAKEWFFVRYNDPDSHIRLRFHGEPEHLSRYVLPQLCDWATGLMKKGLCSRFGFDTYDRELERYGGITGIQIAESFFAVDSQTVAELLALLQGRMLQLNRITLGVLSVDNLLASLGLIEDTRVHWLQRYAIARSEVGQEYRQRKTLLRALLEDPNRLRNESGGEIVAQILMRQQSMLASVAESLSESAKRGELCQTTDTLFSHFVHMHCNRLLGVDYANERKVLGLLLRTREGLVESHKAISHVTLT